MLTKENFGGMDIAEICVSAGLAQTVTAARRAVQNGAIRLNGIRIIDPWARVAVVDGQLFILEKENKA
jgi:ribosomal protein S4